MLIAKSDKTPVSLADFAAQALLVAAIKHSFPYDKIVGEEDTSLLRTKPELVLKIWDLVDETHLDDPDAEALLRPPPPPYRGPEGRVWMIDPVDGTKGFLNQGQYVVCLVFLVDGHEKVAAFGCPHVTLDSGRISESDTFTGGPGYLVSAVRGEGAQIRPLSEGKLLEPKPLGQRDAVNDLGQLRFCENTKTTSPQFANRHKIAAELGAPWDPIHIYSTQLRYISLALGFSDVVLRTPLPNNAPAHSWDHAGGMMVFEETGGKVTDLNGKAIVLTAGRDLTENFGLIAALATIHSRVLEAVRAGFVSSGYPEYSGIIA
ncbi:hypothetical protein B0T26DRAFT_765427 [Lasiosphaeria miniovina]|uniref:3'(2'),5'-bisphosphate nucleotidase n=1 Tax=Lasiosphaeria miniovina TaxID=1954250 RepID=A0AA40E474_9PEZI|nr:uncharacterized protein B0T26DRAFT_765427 [Lasiosphaeria miniovina]KAK0727459.1 hypothetical protein B0T26DRAFT_765427 [Lasiosphaeria miniovina]